jgi:hypothetical protein
MGKGTHKVMVEGHGTSALTQGRCIQLTGFLWLSSKHKHRFIRLMAEREQPQVIVGHNNQSYCQPYIIIHISGAHELIIYEIMGYWPYT